MYQENFVWGNPIQLAMFAMRQLHIHQKNTNKNTSPYYKDENKKNKLSSQNAFGGIEKQKELLEKDGIIVTNYKVDLDKYNEH